MKNFIGGLFDSRNHQVEAHLVLLCLGAVTFIGLSIYHTVILRQNFDPDPYGRGLGELLAGGGAAAWGQGLQRKAETSAGEETDNEPAR